VLTSFDVSGAQKIFFEENFIFIDLQKFITLFSIDSQNLFLVNILLDKFALKKKNIRKKTHLEERETEKERKSTSSSYFWLNIS
jgi:hypothetical protein